MADPRVTGFAPPVPLPPKPEPEPSFVDAYSSGFEPGSDVLNAIDLMTTPMFEDDPSFDIGSLKTKLKATGMWEDYRDNFIGTRSNEEFIYRVNKIRAEQRQREIYARSGWAGVLGSVMSGVTSPTMFIPLVGEARGAKAIYESGKLALLAGGINELPLQLNQETRTAGEGILNVGAQTIIGAVLGSVVKNLSKAELDKLSFDMAREPGFPSVSKLGVQGTDTAIEQLRPVAGTFKVTRQVDLNAKHPFIRTEEKAGADAYEFTPTNALVVSPKSLRFLPLDEAADAETISRYASKQGHDAVIFEGFEKPLAKVEGKVSKLEDGILVLNKAILRSVANDGPALMPRFGDGVDKITVPREPNTFAAGVGSASVRQAAGGLKWSPANWLSFTSPVLRTIEQETFREARWMMQQMSDAGVTMAGAAKGIAAAPGGTVENLAQTYYGLLPKAVEMFDKNYSDFVYGEGGPAILRAQRATISGMAGKNKLSKAEFSAEVSRAMRQGDQHEIPEVAATASALRAQLFDPLFKEAQDAGIFKEVEDVIGDSTYLTRVFNNEAIERKMTMPDGSGFVDKLARYYQQTLEADFAKRFAKYLDKTRRDEQFIADTTLETEAANALRQQFLEELAKKPDPKTLEIEEQMMELRSQLRDPELSTEAKAAVRQHLKELEELGGEKLQAHVTSRKETKRRLNNLNKNRFLFEQRQLAKIEKIDRAEELSIASLNRAIRGGQRFLSRLDFLSDANLDKEINELKTAFAKAGSIYDNGEEQLVKLAADESEKFEIVVSKQEKRAEKLSDLAERVGDIDDLPREEWREAVQGFMDEYSKRTVGIIGRRAQRVERLIEEAKTLDPKIADDFIKQVAERIPARKLELQNFLREYGAEDVDLATGQADFSDFALDSAHKTTDTILGTSLRLPVIDVIQSRHGIEHARVLGLPSSEIEEFLENDVMKLARIYLHTLSGDIAVAKRFGTPNAAEYFQKLDDEYKAKKNFLAKMTKDKKGRPITEERRKTASKALVDNYKVVRRDLEAVLGRIRHTWGIPDNPTGIPARLAKTAININTLRYMGTVVPSSFSDLGRPVMKFGLTRTLRDGLGTLIKDLKTFKASADEALQNGAALDVIIHTRAQQFSDVLDDTMVGTKFERGAQFLASRMGVIAGFDVWTREAKKFTAVVANARMLDAIENVVTGAKPQKLSKDVEYLAKLNITGEMAERMWKEVSSVEGGGRINGVLLPNTKYWQDRELARTYGQALVGQLNNTIVTPGVERPLWMDKNLTGRLLGQFRSFGMSSISKTMIAGLQDRDVAALNGVMISLAFGALSYYVWAVTIGGDAYQEMLDAPLERWADEAIDRSGMLAAGNEFWNAAQRIPGLAPYSTFSGARTSQRQGADLWEIFAGPTYDLLAKKGGGIIMGIDQPTQHTAHLVRQVLPFQNVFYIRQLFTALEEATGLPERRQ